MEIMTIDKSGAKVNVPDVTISLQTYTELMMKAHYCDLVFDAIYGDAELDYTGCDLRFDYETVRSILKVLDSETYHACLEAKIKEKGLEEDRG